MRSKILILFVLLSLCCSCKTSRFFGRKTERSVIEFKDNVSEISHVKTENQATEKTAAQTKIWEDINETILTIKWSEPDSTWQQFPVETTLKIRNSSKKEKSNSEVEKTGNEKTEGDTERIEQQSEKSETDIKTVEKSETKKATPEWVIWVAVIVAIGFLVIVYLILKRYKIVK